jgi:hypothetical protein
LAVLLGGELVPEHRLPDRVQIGLAELVQRGLLVGNTSGDLTSSGYSVDLCGGLAVGNLHSSVGGAAPSATATQRDHHHDDEPPERVDPSEHRQP